MTKYVKVSITTQYNIIRDVKPYRDNYFLHCHKQNFFKYTPSKLCKLEKYNDRLLVTCSTLTSCDHQPDEARRWRAKRRN